LLVGDSLGQRVQPLVRVVHECLEGSVEMRGGLCRGAETHLGAEVVSSLLATCAGVVVARNATLDGDAGVDLEVRGRVRPQGSDNAS